MFLRFLVNVFEVFMSMTPFPVLPVPLEVSCLFLLLVFAWEIVECLNSTAHYTAKKCRTMPFIAGQGNSSPASSALRNPLLIQKCCDLLCASVDYSSASVVSPSQGGPSCSYSCAHKFTHPGINYDFFFSFVVIFQRM